MRGHPQDDEHLVRCADCQARWAIAALDVDLDRVWLGVAAEVWAPPTGTVERLAGWLLRSPGLARALVNTPSLMLSWVIASVLVLAIGVVATHQTTAGPPWVALLAPALAGAAIAYAYGPGVDPAWELSQMMVISDRQVLLVRALAVFGLNALFGSIASLFSGQAVGLTFGWLAPMAMVSALALAAATLARSANVGVAVALGSWAIAVLGAAAVTATSGTHAELGIALAAAVSSGILVPFYLAFAAVCAVVALWATNGRRIGTTGADLPWQP